MTRSELGAFLYQLSARTKSMRDRHIDSIANALATVDFMTHVTDDVYRCTICFAQNTHTPQCFAAKLKREHGEKPAEAK